MDLSKLETGKLHVKLQEFNLQEMLSEVFDTHHQRLSESQIIFHKIIEIKLPSVLHQDNERIQFILNSLLDNAIKFSPTNAEIIFLPICHLRTSKLYFQ